jgi:integrase
VSHVRDLWFTAGKRGPKRKTVKHPDRGGSKTAKRWQAVWEEPDGTRGTETFHKKIDAENYATSQSTDVARGTYVDPAKLKITVAEWCDTWLDGYSGHRTRTVRSAKVHIVQIKAEFGKKTVVDLAQHPSRIKSWCARLKRDGYEPSYIYALHSRLKQIMTDAVHEKIITVNPCSRRTTPPVGKQRAYVVTTGQLWQLHAAMPAYLQVSVLLGAMAGLRVAEACGLRPRDVDLALGIVLPRVQYPADDLKSATSKTDVPIPYSLTVELIAHEAQWPGPWVLSDEEGNQVGPWRLERAIRTVRKKVPGLPPEFRFHDLRHYLASYLISEGADVKLVQARLRHASAKTTLDTYGHLWPDRDESTRTALEAVFRARTALPPNQQNAVSPKSRSEEV